MIHTLRHESVFSPDSFGQRRVDVIGVGATGSHIAINLAKLGISNIHAWDDDVVGSENIANQGYIEADIGSNKTEALRRRCREIGTDIVVHPERVGSGHQLSGDVVFLLTDTMKSRREIAEAVCYNGVTELLIETRLAADMGMIYSINPSSPSQIDLWQETLHEDRVTAPNDCNANVTVGSTAQILAGFATWQLIHWANGAEIDNEIIFTISPLAILKRTFGFI